jgi:hypothetical protein
LKKKITHKAVFLFLLCLAASGLRAQNPGNVLKSLGNKFGGQSSGGAGDSLRARNKSEDSITITIYYLDSSGGSKWDSSINDFTRRYPIPATHIYLGNTGVPTRSILFAPSLKPGWDPGFHALDVYKWTLDKARFFNTTRPYTELGYVLGSRAEQIIEILHTQNIKPSWNFSFNYRLINAPGTFRNQTTNHNNYLFTSWYQSLSKRYNNYFIILGNRLQASENGGIKNERDLDTIPYAKDRFTIPTNLGGDPQFIANFFTTALHTGNRYREFNILLRQQYDFGRKDSLVTDSTVIPLFYPRLRFEHSFNFGTYDYNYRDYHAVSNTESNTPDSAWYHDAYNLPPNDSFFFRDRWKEVSNDFSIYQFPDAKNLRQFIKLGATIQFLSGSFFRDTANLPGTSLYNLIAHGEYRNRTRNKMWDMLASGKLYLNGYNLGDYHAYVSLQRVLGGRLGSFQLGFENVNRTPPFIYNQKSGFYLDVAKNFNKENTTHLFAAILLQKLRLQLSADYYLVSNYLYLSGFYMLQQEKTIFNVLRINALKTFRLGKHWNWSAEAYVQQKTGGAQLHFPAAYTRNRLMYEGKLGFRNLNIAFGLEARYHTPYKADNYSPVLGQFFYQDSETISNRPEIHAFLHFRIRSFKAYIRAENLNTANNLGGFQFNHNNLAAPNYPTPGLIIRFGIYWGFVN